MVIIGLGHISRFEKKSAGPGLRQHRHRPLSVFSQAGISELLNSPGLDKFRYASPVDLRPFSKSATGNNDQTQLAKHEVRHVNGVRGWEE